MKKCLIIPYFGQFNSYFDIWADSCGHNKDIDWLLFTDQQMQKKLPENIKLINMSFDSLREMFKKKLDSKISLSTPYKLCDYRPCYGYLFSDYIKEYDFWGYCDCDVIFGNISKFLNEELFNQYDKILRRGHLSFVRNEKAINENFFSYDTHKIILHSPVSYAYDESISGFRLGFFGELQDKGYKCYESNDYIADIDFRYFPFRLIGKTTEESVFLYKNGGVFQVTRDGKEKEMMYLHLQKRKMKVLNTDDSNGLMIYPNEITSIDQGLLQSKQFWEKISSEKEDYFDFKEERRNGLKRDIKRFIYEPHKIQSIRYRLTGRK